LGALGIESLGCLIVVGQNLEQFEVEGLFLELLGLGEKPVELFLADGGSDFRGGLGLCGGRHDRRNYRLRCRRLGLGGAGCENGDGRYQDQHGF
jgi:hypothetical protein